MEIIKQFGIIAGICLLGEFISAILPFTFPSSVISMLLMFMLLYFKFIKESQIEKVGSFLLNNMAFFFIPAASGIIKEYDALKDSIWILVFITIVSTLITFICTYYAVCFVSKIMKGTGKDK